MIDTMHARAAIETILGKFPDLDADDLNALADAYRDIGQGIDADNVLGASWTVFDGVLRTRAGLVAWAEETAKTLRSFPISQGARRCYDDVLHALHFGLWRHARAATDALVEPDAFLASLLETLDAGVFFNDPVSPQPSSDALRWLLTRAGWIPTPTTIYRTRFCSATRSVAWVTDAGPYYILSAGDRTQRRDALGVIDELSL
jgi:hypothetical protein